MTTTTLWHDVVQSRRRSILWWLSLYFCGSCNFVCLFNVIVTIIIMTRRRCLFSMQQTNSNINSKQWVGGSENENWLAELHVGHSLTNATTMSPRRNLESRSFFCCWEISSRIRRYPLYYVGVLLSSSTASLSICQPLLRHSLCPLASSLHFIPSLLFLLLLVVVSVLLMCCSIYPSLG